MNAGLQLSLEEIAAACGGRQCGAAGMVTGVSSDSRSIAPGELFVALRGEHFDAHDFLPLAIQRGAAAALVARELPGLSIPQVVVSDTRLALGRIAAQWRSRFTAPMLALTGSNGKTTVKEMLREILGAHTGDAAAVHVTAGNLNNDIGVPLTLLAQRAQHRYAVIEMGMNHLGEIDHLVHMANPDVALIIMAGTAHIGELGSREAIARAKGEIIAGLREDGTAVINMHDRFGPYWLGLANGRRTITFGLSGEDNVFGEFNGPVTTLRHAGSEVDVRLAVPGRHNAMNALAAAAGAIALKVPLPVIARGLEAFRGVPGRGQCLPGHNSATIVDDTYNANAESVKAAVQVLMAMPAPRILVLGDMGELGDQAEALHREVGTYAADAGVGHLFTLGALAGHAAEAFGARARHFADIASLIDALKDGLTPRASVLVKGSRFMRMERVVAALVPGYHAPFGHG